MEASSSKKRSRSAVSQVPQGDTQNAEAAAAKEREIKKKSYDKKKKMKIAADLKELQIKYAHLEGKFDQSEKEKQKLIDQSVKEKQKFIDLANRLLEKRREFNKFYGESMNKITKLTEKFYVLLEKDNLRQEAWVGEQNLSQDQNLNFNPDDLLKDN